MADFNIRSDSVNVEDVMRQIRARIREKRGVDYTEQEIRELAAVKLETFLDPSKVRSELLDQYREMQRDQANPDSSLGQEALFGTERGWLRRVRRLLRPILKLFVNPVALERAARVDMARHAELFFALMHNLVVETTRLGIEVKTLKMRVESISSRLDFDERRARAFEGVVQGRPAAAVQEAPPGPATPGDEDEGESEPAVARSRRRRRRRGRRGGQRGGGEETARTDGPQAAIAERRGGVAEPETGRVDDGEPVRSSPGSRDLNTTAARGDEQAPDGGQGIARPGPSETGDEAARDRGGQEPGR